MALISFRRFGGQMPRVHPRLLDPVNATKAVNTRLWNGKLAAFKRPKFDFQTVKAGPITSIYKYRGGGKEGWLHWDHDVDVVKAPLAGDDYGRIYIAGDGRPKFADSTMVIGYTVALAAGASIGVTALTVATNRGFAIGDSCVIHYAPSVTQTIVLTGVTPSGANLVLSFTTPTVGLLTTSNTVTNAAQRYPLVTYDLGVPAPTTKLSLQVLSGGTEGTEGVSSGSIVAVSDIVVSDFSAMNESTIGQLQSGSDGSWMLGPHAPFHDVAGVVSNGQAMVLKASAQVALPINHHNEARDVTFQLHRNPTTTNLLVDDQVTHIVRPSGIGYTDWDYFVYVEGIDVPTAGTYSYRLHFGPVPGLAGDNNNSYNVKVYWKFTARYSNRIKLTLAPDHGLAVGDSIKLTIKKTPESAADRDLDGKIVDVLAVSGNDITIDALYGGVYTPGGTWQKSYRSGETSDRAYVYTYVAAVNGQEFESPPSPATSVITTALTGSVRLSGFINPITPTLLWDTNFSAYRVYRLNAGETAEARYLFLAELPLSTTQHDDSALGETLGEILPTSGWELPPADLVGLIELPEGGAAAFTKKEFCMAEPYFLHAWPAANRRTTHDEIVAIGAFGSSIGIATKGTPYVVTGLDPSTVSMERLEVVQPCLSKDGAIDLGYAFVYPSPDGLTLLAVGRADVVTSAVFTSDEWRALNPSSFNAARYGSRYLCFYDTTIENPTPPVSNTASYEFPAKGGFIFDPQDTVNSLVFLDLWASEVWTDPQTNRVYVVQSGAVREFDADALELEYRWKSKEMVLPRPVSMGFAAVEAAAYPVRLTIFADREPLYTRDVRSSDPFRIPDGEFDSWAVELEGAHQVEGVYLGETIDDLTSYAGGL